MDSIDKARNLRHNQTEAERLLWKHLRNRQLGGVKFRRQHSWPPYVLDFFSEEKKLAIELDGGYHNESEQKEKDTKRTKDLETQGIQVIRLWNNDILNNIEGSLEHIKQHLNPSPSHATHGPLPLPLGEGNKRICVAQIADAHGVKGLVKLRVFAEDETLINGALFTNESGDDTLAITLKNKGGKFWLAEVKDVSDRDAALALKGTKFFIERAGLPETDEGEYYQADLIGLPVEDVDGEIVGKLIAIQNFGAGDMLEIKPSSGSSFYLPFKDENVPEIQTDKIIVSIPEGLS